jgi:hypothetical protein
MKRTLHGWKFINVVRSHAALCIINGAQSLSHQAVKDKINWKDGGRCLFETMLLWHISSYCSRESEETYVKRRSEYQVKAGNRNERENSVMFLLS